MAGDAYCVGSSRKALRDAVIIHRRDKVAPMNRIRTIVCRAALAIAAIFGSGSAWGSEVTVIGASWQPRPISEPIKEDSLMYPVPPSSNTPMQPNAEGESEPPDESFELVHWFEEKLCWPWTIDYRYRALASSGISSTYGTSQPPPTGYAPLSQLDFPINSSWHGLRIGLDEPTWGVHFEWMTPQQSIQGQFSDYDWKFSGPPNPGESYTDLGFAGERWIDAQMIDLGLDFQLTDRTFNLPIEVWPTFGFRWQRFDIECYDGVQVKYYNQWLDPADAYPGDAITFNQQFYTGYLGGQFRTRLRSVLLTFQADWGCTWGYNIDHHLLREGDRYTMESTQGNSWHLGFTAEVPVSQHVRFGFQFDHAEIRTSGTHHLQNLPLGQDSTWDNDVSVSSNQTSVMAFVRFRM